MRIKLSALILVAIIAVVIIFYSLHTLSSVSHRDALRYAPSISSLHDRNSPAVLKGSNFAVIEDSAVIKDEQKPMHHATSYLLRSPRHPSTPYEYSGKIYLDWTRSSYTFNYITYKSLESILVSYPDAVVESIVLGPDAANYYKLGDLMSKHIFEKYKKRGFYVSTRVVSKMEHTESLLGSNYWNHYQIRCCTMEGVKSFRQKDVPPFHVFFFVRLQKLYEEINGGIFVDYSWIHLRPLAASVATGYVMHTSCQLGGNQTSNIAFEELRHISSLKSPVFHIPTGATECYTSTMLVFRNTTLRFRNEHREVLQCILSKYDVIGVDGMPVPGAYPENGLYPKSDLVRCIEAEPEITAGALCIRRAVEDCFTETGIPNDLSPDSHSSSTLQTCLHGGESDLRISRRSSGSGDSQLTCEVFTGGGDSKTVTALLLQHNESLVTTETGEHSESRDGLLDQFISLEEVQLLRKELLARPHDMSSIGALWMGSRLGVGQLGENDWLVPTGDTLLGQIIASNDRLLTRGLTSERTTKTNVCHGYYESPSSQIGNHHPWSAPGIGRASLSCALSFVIPGFMKSASSFLYECLIRHPKVLHAVRGVRFKETGCYLHERAEREPVVHPMSRIDCFPFVESHESEYVYGDATVYYSSTRMAAEWLLRDNPNVKAIFVIRLPISRMISHYKFSIEECKQSGLTTVSDAVAWALRSGPQNAFVMELHGAVVSALESVRSQNICNTHLGAYLYAKYCPNGNVYNRRNNAAAAESTNPFERLDFLFHRGLNPKSKKDRQASTLLYNSLYIPGILHWIKILGSENVLIVQTEKLHLSPKNTGNNGLPDIMTSTRKQRAAIREQVVNRVNRIYRFIGLPDFQDGVLHQELHRTEELLGPKKLISRNTTTLDPHVLEPLRAYLNPFNELLKIVLDITRTTIDGESVLDYYE